MEASRNLRLLDPNGEVADDAPTSYAEALLELQNARARADRLEEENGHLGEALKRSQVQLQRLKAQQHKDLRLHKDYAAVERLWAKYREFHPRSGEDVPDDWLKLGLARMKDFDEAALSRALDGARHAPPVSDDGRHTYDKWDNVFRSTGHVLRYVERADKAETRAQRGLQADPRVADLLRELGVSRLGDLVARCDNCGELMIAHGSAVCDDPDDSQWRSDDWWRRKAEELRRRPGKCEECREPVTADQWESYLVAWADLMAGGKGYIHLRCIEEGSAR